MGACCDRDKSSVDGHHRDRAGNAQSKRRRGGSNSHHGDDGVGADARRHRTSTSEGGMTAAVRLAQEDAARIEQLKQNGGFISYADTNPTLSMNGSLNASRPSLVVELLPASASHETLPELRETVRGAAGDAQAEAMHVARGPPVAKVPETAVVPPLAMDDDGTEKKLLRRGRGGGVSDMDTDGTSDAPQANGREHSRTAERSPDRVAPQQPQQLQEQEHHETAVAATAAGAHDNPNHEEAHNVQGTREGSVTAKADHQHHTPHAAPQQGGCTREDSADAAPSTEITFCENSVESRSQGSSVALAVNSVRDEAKKLDFDYSDAEGEELTIDDDTDLHHKHRNSWMEHRSSSQVQKTPDAHPLAHRSHSSSSSSSHANSTSTHTNTGAPAAQSNEAVAASASTQSPHMPQSLPSSSPSSNAALPQSHAVVAAEAEVTAENAASHGNTPHRPTNLSNPSSPHAPSSPPAHTDKAAEQPQTPPHTDTHTPAGHVERHEHDVAQPHSRVTPSRSTVAAAAVPLPTPSPSTGHRDSTARVEDVALPYSYYRMLRDYTQQGLTRSPSAAQDSPHSHNNSEGEGKNVCEAGVAVKEDQTDESAEEEASVMQHRRPPPPPTPPYTPAEDVCESNRTTQDAAKPLEQEEGDARRESAPVHRDEQRTSPNSRVLAGTTVIRTHVDPMSSSAASAVSLGVQANHTGALAAKVNTSTTQSQAVEQRPQPPRATAATTTTMTAPNATTNTTTDRRTTTQCASLSATGDADDSLVAVESSDGECDDESATHMRASTSEQDGVPTHLDDNQQEKVHEKTPHHADLRNLSRPVGGNHGGMWGTLHGVDGAGYTHVPHAVADLVTTPPHSVGVTEISPPAAGEATHRLDTRQRQPHGTRDSLSTAMARLAAVLPARGEKGDHLRSHDSTNDSTLSSHSSTRWNDKAASVMRRKDGGDADLVESSAETDDGVEAAAAGEVQRALWRGEEEQEREGRSGSNTRAHQDEDNNDNSSTMQPNVRVGAGYGSTLPYHHDTARTVSGDGGLGELIMVVAIG